MQEWQGRIDIHEGPDAIRWHQKIEPFTLQAEPGVVLIGFASDEGVKRNSGRLGAAKGPKALRNALANLAWHRQIPIYDAGDTEVQNENLENAQAELAQNVAQILQRKNFPLILGGGHETAWGTFQGISQVFPKKSVGIINLDAHFDLRKGQHSTSGTPFYQIAQHELKENKNFYYFCLGISEPSNTKTLFQTATELNAKWILDKDLQQSRETMFKKLDLFLSQVDLIYLSIDLDVLPCSQMPAVSAPAPLGVPLGVIEQIICYLAKNKKLIAADIVEFNPLFDIDHHGAKGAARLIWSLVQNLILKQQGF